jgi:hypothetical protein
VSDLVTASGQWNEQLIRETFISVDPAAILRIPLRPNAEDWWAWESEKHGEYSVKTAYRKLADAQQQGEPTTLGGSGDASWNRIWKLNVPPKVKVFWWRVLHEFLPAKSVLYQRHIEQTAFCDLCGAEQESIQHILIHCTVARVFWREFRTVSGLKLPSLHPHYWVFDILRPEVCSEKDRDLTSSSSTCIHCGSKGTNAGHNEQ